MTEKEEFIAGKNFAWFISKFFFLISFVCLMICGWQLLEAFFLKALGAFIAFALFFIIGIVLFALKQSLQDDIDKL